MVLREIKKQDRGEQEMQDRERHIKQERIRRGGRDSNRMQAHDQMRTSDQLSMYSRYSVKVQHSMTRNVEKFSFRILSVQCRLAKGERGPMFSSVHKQLYELVIRIHITKDSFRLYTVNTCLIVYVPYFYLLHSAR
jgi:hypothetical protein